MSLFSAHELGFALSLFLALLSVLLGGALPPALWAAAAVPWISLEMRRRNIVASTAIGTLVSLAGFGWGGMQLVKGGMDESMVAAAIALVTIVVARLITRSTPAHDLQGLVLSLLLVFAGTVLHQQFTYGVVFILYAITVTWALVTRQLISGAAMEGWRRGDASFSIALSRRDVVTPTFFAVTATVALVILLATSLMFVLFPRVGLGGLGLRRAGAHLPTSVSLFGVPRAIQGGSQVVARLRGIDYRQYLQGLYLRGGTYDQLDIGGFSQSDTLGDLRPSGLALAPVQSKAHYEVYLQPVTDQTLLTLGPVYEAQADSGGYANPSARVRVVGIGPTGELMSMTPLTGPLRYSVTGGIATPLPDLTARLTTPAPAHLDRLFTQHFLALPSRLDARIVPLAQELAGNLPTLAARAAAIRNFLLTRFTYSLEQPNTGKADPLAGFLFDDRRGHCEYFATAYAVLLRAVGVPSRVVGGYEGGTWDDDGDVVVFTGANAHAWVEWYAPNVGWLVDDATPAVESARLTGVAALFERLRRAWDDKIVDFGLDEQMELFNDVVGAFRHEPTLPTQGMRWRPLAAALGALVLAVAIWFMARHDWRPARVKHTLLTRALITALERLGGAPLPPQVTLREAVRRLESAQPEAAVTTLREALRYYEARRFGAAAGDDNERHLVTRLRRLRRASSPSSVVW